jgi:hypothetical protein
MKTKDSPSKIGENMRHFCAEIAQILQEKQPFLAL